MMDNFFLVLLIIFPVSVASVHLLHSVLVRYG